jgi:phosphatidylserine decarboxylase
MVRASPTKKIQPFVEELDIDMSTAQKQEFNSFNDFFPWKLKNNARLAENYLDGTLLMTIY